MVAHAIQAHDLDGERVFITGLSAGGAMAAAMLAIYPDLFAGGAVIAGLPYGVARNVQEALGVMNRSTGRAAGVLGALVPERQDDAVLPRLSIWHGDADFTVQSGNAHDLAQQWSALHDPDVRAASRGAAAVRDAFDLAIGDGRDADRTECRAGPWSRDPLSTKAADDVGEVAPFSA